MEVVKKEWVTRYLQCMKLSVEEPSYEYLRKICYAHLHTFPFENISKLIYFREYETNRFWIPDMDTFLKKNNEQQFGGTCYTLNGNLHKLLHALGFQCHFTMLGNEHMAILVTLPEFPNEKVYVDCGAAAPFFEPVRFQVSLLNIATFAEERIQFLIEEGVKGKYKYVRYKKGKINGSIWKFNVNEMLQFDDFIPVIEHSNKPNTLFMSILRCQLWQMEKKRNLSLVNNIFTITYEDKRLEKRELYTIEEIEQVVASEFLLPKLPIREAIEVLTSFGIDIFK